MEVHHHPDLHHKPKKWKEYFLEFLMLFLAVFLGFIAENIRENIAEHKTEREYIHSMINDLKTDTSKLSEIITTYQGLILMQDTLLRTCTSLNNGFNAKFFRNMSGVTNYPDFIYTDATIQQLKNAGGFRILRNRKDIDSIMAYDGIVKGALLNETAVNRNISMVMDLTFETFNFQKVGEQFKQGKSAEQLEAEKFDFLLTQDKNTLSKYYNHLVSYVYCFTLFEKKVIADERKNVGAIQLPSKIKR